MGVLGITKCILIMPLYTQMGVCMNLTGHHPSLSVEVYKNHSKNSSYSNYQTLGIHYRGLEVRQECCDAHVANLSS